MRILFIYTNIDGAHEDNYAFGLATIVSVARSLGHECKVELITERDQVESVLRRFKVFNPVIVGFTSVSSQFGFVNELAKLVKKIIPDVINICGGVHPTLWPESVMSAPFMDFFIVGEGERAFEEFVSRYEKGENLFDSPNLVYQKNGIMMRTPLIPMLEDLEEIPFPDRDIYPLKETVDRIGFAPFHFARGCPFPCTYCANHAQAKVYGEERSRIRAPSPEYCISEIEQALSLHPYINKIAIYDDIFGLNRKWRNEFLELYKMRIALPYLVLLRADVLTRDFAEQLGETGCERIMFGVESGSDYVRNVIMNRTMSEKTIVDAFRLAHEYGIETNAINIIGVPGETEDMLWETIKLNRKIKPTSSGVNIFYPYKGTKLGDYCFEIGLVNDESLSNFSMERRESVLKYDDEWKRKLSYYQKSWPRLVYPFYSLNYIKSIVHEIPFVGTAARSIYRKFISR